ncbi:MAG: NAD-dependent epimerase/dehydratase family protein [Phycisphaerales bacterium]|jgi:UDP-glucuronate 4-epimerase
MHVLVTGAAGFIGAFVARNLLDRGMHVVGMDSLNAYYDPSLKRARLERLSKDARFRFEHVDLADATALRDTFQSHAPRRVVHMAAQAGVRHSLSHPEDYVRNNLVATANLLECCRHADVEHLVFASSSSVYGLNQALPLSTHVPADHPAQFYAATKRSTELMAHAYSNLMGTPSTGLRFFSVYGPWGRPDMVLSMFTKAILEDRPIEVFNRGEHVRDFTYVEDVAEAVARALERPAMPDPRFDPAQPQAHASSAPWRLYNVASGCGISLLRCVALLEACLGRKAQMQLLPLQTGDLREVTADVSDLVHDLGFKPSTPIEVGIERFVRWYREYYGV